MYKKYMTYTNIYASIAGIANTNLIVSDTLTGPAFVISDILFEAGT